MEEDSGQVDIQRQSNRVQQDQRKGQPWGISFDMQKLEEYLENKDIEHKWKKIEEREEKLYEQPHTDTTSRYQRSNLSLPSHKAKPKQKF